VLWEPVNSEEKELRKYNKQLFTEWRNPTSQNYILRDNMKLPKHPSAIYEPVRRDAYWTLSLYKVEGDRLKEEPEIDLLATVDEYKKGYIASYIGPVYSYKGNDLLALYIRPLENHEKKKKVFFIKFSVTSFLSKDHIVKLCPFLCSRIVNAIPQPPEPITDIFAIFKNFSSLQR